MGNYWPYAPPPTTPARYQPCDCAAYAWPHRPGGGLCEWPRNPTYRLTTPSGTRGDIRGWGRSPSYLRLLAREMRAFYRTGRLPHDSGLLMALANVAINKLGKRRKKGRKR